jgi:hypothetical protein
MSSGMKRGILVTLKVLGLLVTGYVAVCMLVAMIQGALTLLLTLGDEDVNRFQMVGTLIGCTLLFATMGVYFLKLLRVGRKSPPGVNAE